MESTFDLIKTLISQLRRSDTRLQKYGAEFHRYSFNPCLLEQDLLAFEENYKLKLPNDYRQFVKCVGNGGVGPNFGIKQLDESILWCAPEKPFCWTQNIDEKDISFPDDVTPGVIQLSVEGYAFPDYLVVNGATFGTVWHSTPAEPLITFNKSFIQWYIEWLELMTGECFEVES